MPSTNSSCVTDTELALPAPGLSPGMIPSGKSTGASFIPGCQSRFILFAAVFTGFVVGVGEEGEMTCFKFIYTDDTNFG